MLEIHTQPIVNVFTGQKVLEECLSRPGCSIREYFPTNDPRTLNRRELHAIMQAIEDMEENTLYNINVTLRTLPLVARDPFMIWRGGVEIVEWGKSISPYFKQTKRVIQDLQSRGLSVWADDVIPDYLSMWQRAGVDGYKVELLEIQNNPDFLKALRETKKPIVVERVETEAEHLWVLEHGIILAQGYYYGRPERLVDNIQRLSVADGG